MEKDRIEELFRDNAFKLERRPSNRAWSRLESRLDRDVRKPRFSMYRGFGLMAASLALALMAYTIVYMGKDSSSEKWVMNDLGVVPTEIEILTEESNSDYANNMYAIVEYSKKYTPRAINFNEGEVGKKIYTKGEAGSVLFDLKTNRIETPGIESRTDSTAIN